VSGRAWTLFARFLMGIEINRGNVRLSQLMTSEWKHKYGKGSTHKANTFTFREKSWRIGEENHPKNKQIKGKRGFIQHSIKK
jgi:hypothetical protein